MILKQFINFLKHERRLAQNTIESYQRDLETFKLFIENTFEESDLEKVKLDFIRSWVVFLMREKLTNRTINRKVASLKAFYKFIERQAAARGEVFKNPTKGVILPKSTVKLPTLVKVSEMKAFNAMETPDDYLSKRDKCIIDLLYATGIRRAELLDLKVSDVNLDALYIKVLGKRKKERLIPIVASLKVELQDYLEIRSASFENCEPFLFLTNKGKKLYPKGVYNIVYKQLSEVTTVEQKSPHVLRHAFASHLLNNGAELNAIKNLLGHESLAATQVYTHTTLDTLKEAYKSAHPKAKGKV
jgi:integrase/recombinase XerC